MPEAPSAEHLAGQVPIPEQQAERRAPMMGRSGLNHWAGYISEEFLTDLRGLRGYRVFDEMRRNEPVVFAMLSAITLIFDGIAWEAKPEKEGDGADKAAADFITRAFARMRRPLSEVMTDVHTMFPFGWALLETNYKYAEGKIWWEDHALRGQDSLLEWGIAKNGDITSFTQMPAPTYEIITIPADKFLLFRTTTEKNNPEGMSLLRAAYKPYFYKKVIEEVEAMGAERDLLGIPVMEVPFGATPDEIEEARKIIENIKNDDQAGIVETAIGPNPEQRFKFRLQTGQGSSGRVSFTDRLITRYSTEIVQVGLASFLRLGTAGSSGGYNLSSDQRDMFQVACRGWLKKIANVWNMTAIPRLLAMNGMTGKCKLEHSRITQLNLQSIANFITSGVQNKWLTPTRELENFLRQEAEIPLLDESHEAAADAPPPVPMAPGAPGMPGAATPSGPGGQKPVKDNAGITTNPGANQRGAGMTPAAAGAKVGLPKAASEDDPWDAEVWEEYTAKTIATFAGDFWKA